MPTLRDIRNRVNAVRNIQQITKAMKMVAAARLRRAQERILHARPYAQKMEEVLRRLVCHTAPELHPLLVTRNTGRTLLLLITADKGLCGSFNSSILRLGWQFYRRETTEGREVFLMAVGRKARDFLRAKSVVPQTEYVHIFADLSYAHASRIREEVLRLYDELNLEAVLLLYNEFKSGGQQKIAWGRILPIEPADPASCPVPVDYLYEPSAQSVLEELLPKYLEVQIYHALLESAAAEQAARLAAMEMAHRNAGEMIDRLTLLYNRVRQERITKELLEVVAGAEALRR
ncbi:MAG: ATP synthase F1 subunit gamma [candidate division NC10 bacterium]|nr:ATP synthase F1 subunit gamma [candidate division NC10 bacterium]